MTHSTPLSRILEYKQLEVLERERLRPLESFRNKLVPSDRKFMGGLILECKKASPSEGLIRADFNIAEIARVYSPFAQAISVLTDEKFFQGSFGLLAQARAQVTCPVLCKDFILSPYQVYEARLYQADMTLLMLSVLDDKTYQTCAQAARKLNLDILTEVHDEQELERAVKLGAEIIGINNRDFKTLKVDLNTSRRLLSLVPKDKIKIVESGIENHDHIREFRDQ
ncbi:MAG: bifunctional indole-3-glycerol phosphate synthase/phosphoribosylanthranilate isomerase, partial [Deltaproteobacteria bacterium]|nr:bifunctional indole-3-glycerol phosphate synthase/phosphoribosylanthranilate isomerase [Deltaproteobacteria bacterium]